MSIRITLDDSALERLIEGDTARGCVQRDNTSYRGAKWRETRRY